MPTAKSGTLEWFFQLPFFTSWRDSNTSQFLRVRGSPGQGKSVLAKRVVQSLSDVSLNGRNKIIYFFCYGQDERFRTATAIFKSLIVQLLSDAQMFKHFPTTYWDKEKFDHADIEKLAEILRNMISDGFYDNIYCIIDALDECQTDRDKFLYLLADTFFNHPSNASFIKFFLTSRPGEDDIESTCAQLRITTWDLKAHSSDVNVFIDKQLEVLPSTRFTKQMKEEAKNQLVDKVGNTFLWISLMLKQLEKLKYPSITAIKDVIDQCPTDLDDLYQRIIDRLIEDEVGAKMLAWVAYSKQTLSIQELEEALSIDPQKNYRNKEETLEDRRHIAAETIIMNAGTILAVNDNMVSLIHETAKDFFDRRNPLGAASAFRRKHPNLLLAEVCIKYLSSQEVIEPLNLQHLIEVKASDFGRLETVAAVRKRLPLLDYAASAWFLHVSSQEEIEHLKPQLQYLVSPSRSNVISWLFWTLLRFQGGPYTYNNELPLAIAIEFEIVWLIEYILSQRNTIICRDMPDDWLLNGIGSSDQVLQLLISRDSSPELRITSELVVEGVFLDLRKTEFLLNQYSITLITEEVVEEIACRCNKDAMKFLLSRQVYVKGPGQYMIESIQEGDAGKTEQVLLSRGATINISQAMLENAAANETFGVEMLEFLLSYNATLQVTEEVMKVAVANKGQGSKVFEFLLLQDERMKISERIKGEAIANIYEEGAKIFKILFLYEILKTAAAGTNEGVNSLSLSYLPEKSRTILQKEIMTADVKISNEMQLKILLSRNKHLNISNFIAKKAPTTRISSLELTKLVLFHETIKITKETLKSVTCILRYEHHWLEMELFEISFFSTDEIEPGENLLRKVATKTKEKLQKALPREVSETKTLVEEVIQGLQSEFDVIRGWKRLISLLSLIREVDHIARARALWRDLKKRPQIRDSDIAIFENTIETVKADSSSDVNAEEIRLLLSNLLEVIKATELSPSQPSLVNLVVTSTKAMEGKIIASNKPLGFIEKTKHTEEGWLKTLATIIQSFQDRVELMKTLMSHIRERDVIQGKPESETSKRDERFMFETLQNQARTMLIISPYYISLGVRRLNRKRE